MYGSELRITLVLQGGIKLQWSSDGNHESASLGKLQCSTSFLCLSEEERASLSMVMNPFEVAQISFNIVS